MICNNIPYIKNDNALEERFILISFEHSFRNTKEQKPNLARDIINSDGDMEWLIYHAIEAYKEMIEHSEGFKLKLSAEETRKLRERNTNPIYDILDALILKVDIDAYNDDIGMGVYQWVYVNELRDAMQKYAIQEGIPFDLPSERSPKIKNAIERQYDLADGIDEMGRPYKTMNRRDKGVNRRYYPFLYMKDEYYKLIE